MVTCSNLKIKAYGKINLALDIVGKRDDGYHILNTVMQSVSCFDLLDFTLSEGEGIELTCKLDSFPKGEDNIITKAYHAFADFTHIDFGCKITVNVEKNLPSQAGMGGGSADAAATLRALDFMFDTRLTDEQLCSIGVALGADVPFCITGGTRLCQGVGEIMSNLPSPDCAFVIIKPDVGISTPEAFKKYDDLNASIQENVSAIRVVKAYVREDFEQKKFKKASGNLYKMFVKAESLIALNNPVMMFVIYSCIMLISWLGAKNVVAGAMKTGELSSVFTYVISAMMSLMMLSMIFVMISMSTASIRRISEILKETPDLHNGENPAKDMKDGSVDFNNVSFSYKHGSGKMVLNNIDLHIKSGETIGIIGSTGCGKTSLVNLISRLYDVDDGSVCVGGKDVRDYDMEYLRDQVSVVLQKNVLFSGTILDNLRWGNENATDAECIEACEAACADEFIERFPDKYETYIEQGGTNVSGGQKQRLCIARALLKKPKVLILDDSTSAVDTATDAKIRAAFAKSIPGTTKFIIAQRISSVQDADRIIVLDGGRVNGFDTHEKLVETNEIYREIYESQVKGGGDFDVQSAGKEEA